MAYFGRKPQKPGSVPGAGSGFEEQERQERVGGAIARRVDQGRPSRAGRALKAVRGARGGRSAR